MTNKSISLIITMEGKSYEEKEAILREVVSIEFHKIKAQAKVFFKHTREENQNIADICNIENSDALYDYLNQRTIEEISMLTACGIDVGYMNLIKVAK